MDPVPLVAVLFAVAIVETILSGTWNVTYFRFGITVFYAKRNIVSYRGALTDASKIETAIPGGRYKKLLFRNIGPNLFVFREACFSKGTGYSTMMRGNLVVDSRERVVRVIGKANWFSLYFLVLIAIQLIPLSIEHPPAIIFLIGCFAFGAYLYEIQRRRFVEVADIVSGKISTLV